jgi:hypothetical protein
VRPQVRSHVTWVQKVRKADVILGRDHRVACSCGWLSEPVTYAQTVDRRAIHLQLVQLRSEMRKGAWR